MTQSQSKSKHAPPKATSERITLKGEKKSRVVYVGPRGGKYIKTQGKFVSIKQAPRKQKGGYAEHIDYINLSNLKTQNIQNFKFNVIRNITNAGQGTASGNFLSNFYTLTTEVLQFTKVNNQWNVKIEAQTNAESYSSQIPEIGNNTLRGQMTKYIPQTQTFLQNISKSQSPQNLVNINNIRMETLEMQERIYDYKHTLQLNVNGTIYDIIGEFVFTEEDKNKLILAERKQNIIKQVILNILKKGFTFSFNFKNTKICEVSFKYDENYSKFWVVNKTVKKNNFLQRICNDNSDDCTFVREVFNSKKEGFHTFDIIITDDNTYSFRIFANGRSFHINPKVDKEEEIQRAIQAAITHIYPHPFHPRGHHSHHIGPRSIQSRIGIVRKRNAGSPHGAIGSSHLGFQ